MLAQIAAVLAFGWLLSYIAEAVHQHLIAKGMKLLTLLLALSVFAARMDACVAGWQESPFGRILQWLEERL